MSEQISLAVTVDAPRSQVWKIWTTVEGVSSFMGVPALVELRLGGPFEVHFDPTAVYGSRGSEGCVITAFVPEEMLCFTWNAPPSLVEARGRRTFVVVQLSDAGPGKTTVKLTNGGYLDDGPGRDAFAYLSKAWPAVLDSLKHSIAEGEGSHRQERSLAEVPDRGTFAYFIYPVRNDFFEGKPTAAEAKAIQEHFGYLQALMADSTLVMAGRAATEVIYPSPGGDSVSLDIPSTGIVVFNAVDESAAKRILGEDPAVKAGVFKGRVSRFGLAFERP